MIRFSICVLLGVFLLAGCSRKEKFTMADLAQTFVYQSLAYSPVSATSAGYHTHRGIPLDQLLDDMSEQSFSEQRQFYRATRTELKKFEENSPDPEMDADGVIIRNQVELAMLELTEIQSYKHNPTLYVETIGNGLFSLFALESAPKEDRFRNIIARLDKIPSLLEQAKANLVDSPEIWNKVAREENEGNLNLVDQELRKTCPEALRGKYDAAAVPALAALRAFQDYLEKDLSKRTSDWRLGADKYAKKFRYSMAVDSSSTGALAEAQTKFKIVRNEMEALSADTGGDVRKKLAIISKNQSAPSRYFSDVQADLEEARTFVRKSSLLTLPERDNLKVIETPEFMRGIYSVGGFNPAPALEPKLGAYYWLTPIPKDWPKDRVASKLREYNIYALKLLTLHEAMPGHYVQAEYANDVKPEFRRLLRSVYGSGPYVEGWAVYITEQMLDAGYLNKSPELRLTFLKQQLRMIANTILDISLHTTGMRDEEAMKLMMEDAFQEEQEARGKLQRAKLSSCQLPTYYLGYREWMKLKDQQMRVDQSQSLATFHRRALAEGAVSMVELAKLLNEKPSATQSK